MSNLTLYFFGYLLLIAGAAYGAMLMGVPPTWIGVGVIMFVGVAIISGVSSTRYRETSPADSTTHVVVD